MTPTAPLVAAAECVNHGIEPAASLPAPALIIVTGVIGVLFSVWLLGKVSSVQLNVTSVSGSAKTNDSDSQNKKLTELYDAIR